MIVRLSPDEGMAAAVVGATQMIRATARGWVGNDHGGKSGRAVRERWAQAIHGAMAELAAACALGRPWRSGVDGITGGDIGTIQVRATPWDDGHLIINEADVKKWPDAPFLLVTGHWPELRMVGWMLGADAAQPAWFRANERPPSYWVPQASLRPFEELAVTYRT